VDEILERDGVLVGPERAPVNPAQQGSIHDDSVARKLGFRGGTIAGSIHMEQFPPLLLRAFGSDWLRSGSLSLYFLYPTLHLEPVRCFVRAPGPDARTEVWMENEGGTRVCEGSASVGAPDRDSALRARLERAPARGDVRILAALQPGMKLAPTPARIGSEELDERLRHLTEPLDAYRGGPPWNGPVLPPTLTVQALRRAEAGLESLRAVRAIGLFGAIEVQYENGPLFAERDYVAAGRVLAVGETPRSEYFWYESEVRESEGSPCAARMLMMLRFMKGSSPLWS
jgi:hypothetical protein